MIINTERTCEWLAFQWSKQVATGRHTLAIGVHLYKEPAERSLHLLGDFYITALVDPTLKEQGACDLCIGQEYLLCPRQDTLESAAEHATNHLERMIVDGWKSNFERSKHDEG